MRQDPEDDGDFPSAPAKKSKLWVYGLIALGAILLVILLALSY